LFKQEFLYLIGNGYLSKKINEFFGLNYFLNFSSTDWNFIFLKNYETYPEYPKFEDIQNDFFDRFRETPVIPKILFLSNPSKKYHSMEKIREIYFNNLDYFQNLSQNCQILYGNSSVIQKRFSCINYNDSKEFQINFIYLNKLYYEYFKNTKNFKNLMIPYIIDKESIKDLLKIKESLPAKIFNGYRIPEKDLNKEIEILSLNDFLKELKEISERSFLDLPYEINFKNSEIITLKEFQEKVLEWTKDTKCIKK